MPISGVVITCRADATESVIDDLRRYRSIEIQGADERGNIVAVLDTRTSEEMDHLIDTINRHRAVLSAGMTYLNTEDEAARMASGEHQAKPFGFRKPLNPAPSDDNQ